MDAEVAQKFLVYRLGNLLHLRAYGGRLRLVVALAPLLEFPEVLLQELVDLAVVVVDEVLAELDGIQVKLVFDLRQVLQHEVAPVALRVDLEFGCGERLLQHFF